MIRALRRSPVLAFLAAFSATASASAGDSLSGFAAASAARQRAAEAAFAAIPSPERARDWHRHFTAEPHPAGSERNHELALFIAEEWKKQGLEDVVIHRYDVLNTAPLEVSLTMVAPVRYEASLREEPIDADPDTRNPRVSPGYLGLSVSADVEAPVVYAHSGNPEDYEVLRKNGIDVRGKIVLVRYSNPYSYRGFKALTAERQGAAGILIYSDPAEDGFSRGPVFPDGPWGPESHIQRGAITYDFIVPGDPLTPGWPSLPGARQVKPEEARSLPKIAGLPLSWKDAKPLLENMDGPVAPRDWQGGLPSRVPPRRQPRPRSPEGPDGQPGCPELRGRGTPSRLGSAGRLGRPRQPPRRLGVRGRRSLERHRLPHGGDEGLRRAAQVGEAATTHTRLLLLGRGGGRAHGLDRVGRELRGGPRREGRRLPERRLLGLRPRLPARRGRLAGASRPRSRAGDRGPGHAAAPRRGPEGRGGEGTSRGTRRHPTGRRRPRGRPHRQRLGPHGLPEPPRGADDRAHVRRALRRLPLDVRRLRLDEPRRRPRVPLPRAPLPDLGHPRPAPRERRPPAVRLRGLRPASAPIRGRPRRGDGGGPARPRPPARRHRRFRGRRPQAERGAGPRPRRGSARARPGAACQPGRPRGRAQLARPRWAPRPPVVQAHALRGPLHLRPPRAARPHGGCGREGLGSGGPSGGDPRARGRAQRRASRRAGARPLGPACRWAAADGPWARGGTRPVPVRDPRVGAAGHRGRLRPRPLRRRRAHRDGRLRPRRGAASRRPRQRARGPRGGRAGRLLRLGPRVREGDDRRRHGGPERRALLLQRRHHRGLHRERGEPLRPRRQHRRRLVPAAPRRRTPGPPA